MLSLKSAVTVTLLFVGAVVLATMLETVGRVVSIVIAPVIATVRVLPFRASVNFLLPMSVSPPATEIVPSSAPSVFTTVIVLSKPVAPPARLYVPSSCVLLTVSV